MKWWVQKKMEFGEFRENTIELKLKLNFWKKVIGLMSIHWNLENILIYNHHFHQNISNMLEIILDIISYFDSKDECLLNMWGWLTLRLKFSFWVIWKGTFLCTTDLDLNFLHYIYHTNYSPLCNAVKKTPSTPINLLILFLFSLITIRSM